MVGRLSAAKVKVGEMIFWAGLRYNLTDLAFPHPQVIVSMGESFSEYR